MTRSKQRVTKPGYRLMPEKEDAAAGGAAAGDPCSEARPKNRNKAGTDGSKRTKAKQAASKPAKQPEKQPASHMPAEAPSPHRDEAACLQQSIAHVELPSQTNADQSKIQAPGVQDQSPPAQQEGSTDAQAAQKTGQVRKQKAAKRKAAKNKGANLQIKPSASSSDLSTGESSLQRAQQEQATAAARVPGYPAGAKHTTQPHQTKQSLHRVSSPEHTAPQPAPEIPQVLQQSTSESSTGRNSTCAGPKAAPCVPCLPNLPNGQPTNARPAPVRLSKTTLQHSQSSSMHSRPPPLHALLPTSSPQLHHIQVWNIAQLSWNSRAHTSHLCPLVPHFRCSADFHDPMAA